MKLALISAHDALLTARVKQTVQANRKCRASPLVKGDLVYISTKNINFPRGTSRKLVPKFISPYCIMEDFGNNSYHIELPDSLKQRGVHNVFHSSLLRIHVANDDQLFPSRSEEQIPDIGGRQEWAIEKILAHQGSHLDATFDVQWASGDRSWVPYCDLEHLRPLKEYFEALGVDGVENLGGVSEVSPSDDPQVSLGHMKFAVPRTTHPRISSRSHRSSASSSRSQPASRSTRALCTPTPARPRSHSRTYPRPRTSHAKPIPGTSAACSHNHCHRKSTEPIAHSQTNHRIPVPTIAEPCACKPYPRHYHRFKCTWCPIHCPCRAPVCVRCQHSTHTRACCWYQSSPPPCSSKMPPVRSTSPIRTLCWAGPNSYTVRRDDQGDLISIHLEQIQLYLAHDQALRSGNLGHPQPIGYLEFASHFNTDKNSRDGTTQFTLLTPDKRRCISSQVSLALKDVLRTQDAQAHRQKEQETVEGTWYLKDCAEIVNTLTWEHLVREQRGKKA